MMAVWAPSPGDVLEIEDMRTGAVGTVVVDADGSYDGQQQVADCAADARITHTTAGADLGAVIDARRLSDTGVAWRTGDGRWWGTCAGHDQYVLWGLVARDTTPVPVAVGLVARNRLWWANAELRAGREVEAFDAFADADEAVA